MTIFKGTGTTTDYAEVLREVRYEHDKPEDVNVRIFMLICGAQDGETTSNQLRVEVSVLSFYGNIL